MAIGTARLGAITFMGIGRVDITYKLCYSIGTVGGANVNV